MEPRARAKPPPFFTAPRPVVWLAGLLVIAHLLRLVAPEGLAAGAFYHLALIPERLDLMLAEERHALAYTPLALIGAGLGHVLLHADWLHVGLNAVMLLALGAPVARRLGARAFLLLFLVSALGGAIVYFALRLPDGAPAIGASGGVSGIIAAALLLMQARRPDWRTLISPGFLRTSAAFVAINIALALFGPSLFGSAIAWDAHLGGYFAGALGLAAISSRRT